MKKEISHKQKVLMILNDFGRKSSSQIGSIAGINYSYIVPILNDLKKQKLIYSIKETNSTYWKITEKGLKEINFLEKK